MSAFERIYLDHAATTPVLPEAYAAMAGALDVWANPSSPHADGRQARAALEAARRTIAESLGWRHDVIFTSGATEALHIAGSRVKVPGRIIGATEHDAVISAMGASATTAPVGSNGLVDLETLADALNEVPALVAVQHVNNETGVVQPVDRIFAQVREAGSLLLADCAQSAGKLPLPDADFIAISGHKFGAPSGIGALLVKDIGTLSPSGGQERGYRRGTENLAGATAMAAALDSCAFGEAVPRIRELRGRLEKTLLTEGGEVIAANTERSPFIGAYAMPGVASASQLVQFDLAGISVSAGSACSSGSMKASRVLAATGVAQEIAGSVVRVSFGPRTTADNIDRFVNEWCAIRDRAAKAVA
nr:aminotransferase class V-fold PLP-dependent enzyme [Sphingomonas hankyongi]